MTATVTHHAAQRWIERVDGQCTHDQAVASIMAFSGVIEKAAQFGCRVVRLGSGAKLILDGANVITILNRGHTGGHHFGEKA